MQLWLIVNYALKTNFNIISIGIQIFSLKKCCLQFTRQICQIWPNWPELTRLCNHSPWHMMPSLLCWSETNSKESYIKIKQLSLNEINFKMSSAKRRHFASHQWGNFYKVRFLLNFIQWSEFENLVCKVAVIVSRPNLVTRTRLISSEIYVTSVSR